MVRTIGNYVDNSYDPPADWVFEGGVWKDGVSGTTISHGSDNDENIVSVTAYNARGQVRRTQDLFGVVTLYGYDDADRLVKTVVNASEPYYNNNYTGTSPDPDLSAYTGSSPADNEDITTEQAYDAAGNRVKSTESNGQVTFTVYDALNRPIKGVRAAKDTATVDKDLGDSGYNAALDPRSASYVISSEPDRDMISTTDYDPLGRVVRTQRLLETRFGLTEWDTTLYGYDELGRQVRVIQHASEPDYFDTYTDPSLTAYDSNVGLSASSDADMLTETVYDAQGRVRYTVDVNDTESWTVYDGLGRQIKTVRNATSTGGSPEDASYVGDLDDPAADIIRQTFYDSNGRVQRTQQVLRTNDAGTDLEWVWTLIGYDDLGRQVKTVQNASVPTYFDSYTDPDLSDYETNITVSTASDEDVISTTAYDSQGRVVKTSDPRSNVTLMGYDSASRRVKTVVNASDDDYFDNFTDPDLSDYETNVTLSSNTDEDRISETEYGLGGRVTSTTDAAGNVTRFVYDVLGRRVRTVNHYVAQGASDPADWVWDASQSRWEDGASTAIAHGTDNDQNQISDTTYNRAGRVTQTRDARGTLTTFTYDTSGRRLTVTRAAGITALERAGYTAYDKAGRVLHTIANYVNPDNNGSPIFASPDNWLWSESNARWEDGNGVVIAAESAIDENLITAFAYDRAARRTQIRDGVGNLTQTAYNKDGSVKEMTDAESVVTGYSYDALRRRVQVVAGQGTAPSGVSCDVTVAAGDVSGLITAITNANSSGTPTTICLTDSTYTLTAVDNTDTSGPNGLPVITGDITIYGNNAIIQRDATAPAFRLFKVDSGGQLTLQAVTLNGGDAGTGAGGGVRNLGTLTLIDARVENGSAVWGGGLHNLGTLSLTNGQVLNNSADHGGGLYGGDGSLTVTGTTITGNSANNNGGGIYMASDTDLTLTNATLTNNDADASAGLGGGLYMNGDSIAIDGGDISSNDAYRGGGVYVNQASISALLDGGLTVNSNHASNDGGGLYVVSGVSLTLDAVTLDGNHADDDGGGIYTNGTLTVTDSAITNNTSDDDAGGIYNSGTLSLTDTAVDSNSADSVVGAGGGIRDNGTTTLTGGSVSGNSAHDGGGLYLSNTSLSASGVTIANNVASADGGGAYLASGSDLTLTNSTVSDNDADASAGLGGGVFMNGDSLAVSGGSISSNDAYRGGGLYVNQAPTSAVLNNGAAINSNSASGDGGGLYLNSDTLTLDGVTLDGNHTDDDGGAAYVNGGLLDVDDALIQNNTADDKGGAIYAVAQITVDTSQLLNNSATSRGGAVHVNTSSASHINGSCIDGNTSADTGGVYSGIASFDANGNWWGDASGPGGSGPGTGDAVNGNVDASSFVTTGCGL